MSLFGRRGNSHQARICAGGSCVSSSNALRRNVNGSTVESYFNGGCCASSEIGFVRGDSRKLQAGSEPLLAAWKRDGPLPG